MDPEDVVLNIASAKTLLADEAGRAGNKTTVDPGSTAGRVSDGDLSTLRKKFPFLADFSDEFIRTTPTEALLKMETTSIKMKEMERTRDVDDRLCTNKLALEETIARVMAGIDNRTTHLHEGRFLAGAACSATKLYKKARQVIGLTGHAAVGSYDMASVGLAGYVTSRGWIEMANPSSPRQKLQQYSINNCSARGKTGSATGEEEGEILELGEFKLAVRAMRTAASFVRPWDFSFLAIEGYLIQSQYCEKDLAHVENKAGALTKFVNYCLGQNADRWRDGEGFLTTGELATHWASFIGAMPQSARGRTKEKKPTNSDKQGGRSDSRRKWLDICFPWNNGNCLKAAGDCKSSRGTVLRHVCNFTQDRSKPELVCGKDHPRCSFHK